MKRLKRYRLTGGGVLGLLVRYKRPLVCIATAAFILAAYSLACADDIQTRQMQAGNTLETHEERTETHAQGGVKVELAGVKGELEGVKNELEEAKDEWEAIGDFRITAYCGGECCCGAWADENCTTASGAKAVEGVTVAADTSVLPFGTILRIDGKEYTVQDTGGAVKGNRLDMYFENHEDALKWGVKTKEVEVKNE